LIVCFFPTTRASAAEGMQNDATMTISAAAANFDK
jgi:hypothetical protein